MNHRTMMQDADVQADGLITSTHVELYRSEYNKAYACLYYLCVPLHHFSDEEQWISIIYNYNFILKNRLFFKDFGVCVSFNNKLAIMKNFNF